MSLLYCSVSSADPLIDLLENKKVEHVGVCYMTARGEVTLDETKVSLECVVGYEIGNQFDRWVLLYRKGKPDRLVKLNLQTKQQEVLWRNPDTMV